VKLSDIVMTPQNVATAVLQHFKPQGVVLDPCRGDGAFFNQMEGALWCEVREGRDFFQWDKPVDWIVSNPPYSVFSDFMRHSFTVAENIVYLIPVNKVFNSDKMLREIFQWGGVPEILVFGAGGKMKFPIGFCIGAVHFKRGFKGPMKMTFAQ
jgi:hypothetical protein